MLCSTTYATAFVKKPKWGETWSSYATLYRNSNRNISTNNDNIGNGNGINRST